jgi:hypothetical protein
MTNKRRYLRGFKEPNKKLASEFSDAVLEVGRIATSMQFLDNYRADFLRHRSTINRLDKLSKEELGDAASSSLDFVTNLMLKWQIEGVLD